MGHIDPAEFRGSTWIWVREEGQNKRPQEWLGLRSIPFSGKWGSARSLPAPCPFHGSRNPWPQPTLFPAPGAFPVPRSFRSQPFTPGPGWYCPGVPVPSAHLQEGTWALWGLPSLRVLSWHEERPELSTKKSSHPSISH